MTTIPEAIAVALQHHQAGRIKAAEQIYREVLAAEPNQPDAIHLLGVIAHQAGMPAVAIDLIGRAIQLKATESAFYTNLGNAFKAQWKLEDAVASYRRSLELNPNDATTLNNLANALRAQGKLDDSVAGFRRALEIKPDFAEALSNLGNAFQVQGKLDDAIASYRRAVEIKPDFAEAHSNLLCTLSFSSSYDAQTIYEEHRRWNRQHAEPLANLIQPHPNERSTDRRLRIGYVSPDFRRHVVGLFLLPLLEAHDHERFEIFCYASVLVPDAITDRCRTQADVWRDVRSFSHEQLAQAVRQDQIDILVDLTMHMALNRLLVFARKPAPVQVAYLAYPGTTGLSTMDYRLTDPYLDPPAPDEPIYCEESICLPETYWCYRPLVQAPAVNNLPALGAGCVTFGCLNNFGKVTDQTLAAWLDLLQKMPDARLLLHAHAGNHRDRVRDLFAQRRIAPDRLTFADMVPVEKYYQLYHQIDIALDPFPYGGGTTSCDALWMGVPVVSLAGQNGRRPRWAQHLVERGSHGISGARLRAIRSHCPGIGERCTALDQFSHDAT